MHSKNCHKVPDFSIAEDKDMSLCCILCEACSSLFLIKTVES